MRARHGDRRVQEENTGATRLERGLLSSGQQITGGAAGKTAMRDLGTGIGRIKVEISDDR